MHRDPPRVEARGSVPIGGETVPYEIVRSPRARHIRLRVGPDPILRIIAPPAARLGAIPHLLEPHGSWILRQLAAFQTAPGTPPHPIQPGQALPFLGASLCLRITAGPPAKLTVARQGDLLVVHLPDGDDHLLPAALEAWYRDQARAVLHQRASHWSARLGLAFGRLSIRDQRTRWGSCSSEGNLNFSWRLVMAPMDVLDYVVIHELTHLRIPNHSPRFWQEVARHCPAYREHIGWLKDHGDSVSGFLRT
jgi:predicted metal-dependent hydrolase